MTTQHEYNDYENTYNLISHEGEGKDFKVMAYKYINNNNVSSASFENTKAYHSIKTTDEKVLLIKNNDLDIMDNNDLDIMDNNDLDIMDNNDLDIMDNENVNFDNKNKYFMLINIDGWINSRRFKIIPFDSNNFEDKNIPIQEKKFPGGDFIQNTFYINVLKIFIIVDF